MENVLLLEIKQLYDSLVAAPYGEYVHGYGTQKPNGFKYKSNAQTLFNKVVELNEKCRPSYIDEQTIFQLSHTLEKEVEHVVGTYEEAIKPNAAQKRWQELDDKMNRATAKFIWISIACYLILKKPATNKGWYYKCMTIQK